MVTRKKTSIDELNAKQWYKAFILWIEWYFSWIRHYFSGIRFYFPRIGLYPWTDHHSCEIPSIFHSIFDK